MPKRLVSDLFLLVAGLLYVVMVLCDNVECRSFAVVYVALAAQELVRAHGQKD
jgi:hypothetical protein